MRILIISDTHGQLDRFWDVFYRLQKEAPVDTIVHCGDHYRDAEEIRRRCGLPVLAVPGNCDGDHDEESFALLETEAGDFLVTHGHMLDVGHDLSRLYYKTLEAGCTGAFFGHTHRSVYLNMDGVHLLNPGSLPRPRDGLGGTFAVVETGPESVQATIYRYASFMGEGGDQDGGDNGGGGKGSEGGDKPAVKGGRLRRLLNYSDRF